MTKKLLIYSKIFFAAYLFLGGTYVLTLLILISKSASGFVMVLLNIVNQLLTQAPQIHEVLSVSNAELTLVIGILWVGLLVRFLVGTFRSANQLRKSIAYSKTLIYREEPSGLRILKNLDAKVFTLGLWQPHIYISETLKNSLPSVELQSILLHEKSHQQDLDPLRGFIVQFINNILPPFPFKNYLQQSYSTLQELKCDYHSELQIEDNKSLLKALRTVLLFESQAAPRSQLLSSFSDKPERIPILLGKQKFQYRFLTSILVVTASGLLLLLVTVYSYNYYDCAHLEECLKILLENVNQQRS